MLLTGSGNANKISGIPVVSGIPSDTYTLNYDAASNRWVYAASGSPAGGSVGGGASVAAGQVLYGVSPGVAGSEAAFSYDAVNDRLNVGIGNQIKLGTASGFNGIWINAASPNTSNFFLLSDPGASRIINSPSGERIDFRINNSDIARLTTPGNLLLGTTTDDTVNRLQVAGSAIVKAIGAAVKIENTNVGGIAQVQFNRQSDSANRASVTYDNVTDSLRLGHATAFGLTLLQSGDMIVGTGTTAGSFRFDIQVSGSSGTLRAYDQTPTTGVTQLIVRAGAGQSSTNLQTWQNAAGTSQGTINATGDLTINGQATFPFSVSNTYFGAANRLSLDSASTIPFLAFRDTGLIQFSSTSSYADTKDLSISRASANVLQVGDGGANALGTIKVSTITSTSNLVFAPGNGNMFTGWGVVFNIPSTSGATGITLSGNTAAAFPLDVAFSGSTGTARFWSQTATTGVTQVVVRAGAGQSSTNLMTWQNAAGTEVSGILADGRVTQALATPASAAATGTLGTITWDANYIYIATGTNTWKRVAIATW